MGLLVDGKWQDQWYDTSETGGRFKRDRARFRSWITPDGSPGPTGEGGFKAESGRYHLYVSYACPWAHRTLIYRRLKGLEEMITLSVVNPLMLEQGWTFAPADGVVPDPVMGAEFMHQIYTAAQPDYTGRVTVPVLWDREKATIVSNESADIIRMFGSAFDGIGATALDLRPAPLRTQIDALNDRIYRTVNNGVYKAGFATSQQAYDEAVAELFDSLDWLESILETRPYLTGPQITEADWRLFTTLVRFDPVYVGHFKCNLRRIKDYPALSRYLHDLYRQPGVAGTVRMDHIKTHYYGSHPTINPSGIVPIGPEMSLDPA